MAYIYLHRRNDTGEVFYVGKGSGKRAYKKDRRNAHWHAVVNKAGYTVEIIAKGLTDEEAYWVEPLLIEAHGGVENLTNQTKGGDGVRSEYLKELWKDPIFRERQTEAFRKARQDGQVAQKISQTLRARTGNKCGHEWIDENIYTFPNGRRTCRICFRDRVREWRHRQRGDKT